MQVMDKFEKIKKIFYISLGFALATYLIMSGMAMYDVQKTQELNTTQSSK